jgi:hypothetical protein
MVYLYRRLLRRKSRSCTPMPISTPTTCRATSMITHCGWRITCSRTSPALPATGPFGSTAKVAQ